VSGRIRVAVIAGGRSSEHEISLASARGVLAALDPARYEVVTVGIGRDGRWALQPPSLQQLVARNDTAGRDESAAATLPVPRADGGGPLERLGTVDVALPILHGPFGEDGTVQGLLELADVPYVGAGVAASALCMDKDLFKKVMRDSGVPVARHHALREGDEVENPFGYPVFVKPARLGSSIGITKVYDEAQLADAVALARRHDDKVLVEQFVPGMEVECSVLGNRQPPPIASLPGRIDTLSHDWYDWSSKYDEGEMELVVPPELPRATIERVQELAVAAFVASECEGLARVDFFVRDDNEVIVNELNTMPGFTATSVYAKLFEASGIPYAELLDRLIALALERSERRRKLEY
jgi:D-alanine-D-alanine ligase